MEVTFLLSENVFHIDQYDFRLVWGLTNSLVDILHYLCLQNFLLICSVDSVFKFFEKNCLSVKTTIRFVSLILFNRTDL